jgi:hypothetical protein
MGTAKDIVDPVTQLSDGSPRQGLASYGFQELVALASQPER